MTHRNRRTLLTALCSTLVPAVLCSCSAERGTTSGGEAQTPRTSSGSPATASSSQLSMSPPHFASEAESVYVNTVKFELPREVGVALASVRTAPDGPVIGKLERGRRVTAKERDDGWLVVKAYIGSGSSTKGVYGFMHSSTLELPSDHGTARGRTAAPSPLPTGLHGARTPTHRSPISCP